MQFARSYQSIILLFVQISAMFASPLHLQLLQPLQDQIMLQTPQQNTLQQQLLALQQIQMLQKLNSINSPIALNLQQPTQLILLPSTSIETKTELKNIVKINDSNEDTNQVKLGNVENGDSDTVVIEAEPQSTGEITQKAILLVPTNARFSIGDFISGISWLPIEVNVPDTISWAYNGISNGISSIISGIGQRLPFRPKPQAPTAAAQETSLKLLLNKLQANKQVNAPIFVVPLTENVLPLQF